MQAQDSLRSQRSQLHCGGGRALDDSCVSPRCCLPSRCPSRAPSSSSSRWRRRQRQEDVVAAEGTSAVTLLGNGEDVRVSRLARAWLAASVFGTLAAIGAASMLPSARSGGPCPALVLLLFAGSSMHVASTAWLPVLPDVRACMRAHPVRFIATPIFLVSGGAVATGLLSESTLNVVLEGFFAWQFLHFAKQNVGVATLAATSSGVRTLRIIERRSIVAAGSFGIAALLARPQLLQLPLPSSGIAFALALAGFVASVVVGARAVASRDRASRPWTFLAGYVTALCFSAPIFVFSSPYAAVGGLTIAHGLQYLVLVGLVAIGPATRRHRWAGLVTLVNAAIVGGLILGALSDTHHDPGVVRGMFGVFLGLTAAHFVVDAGLWRLRDPSSRKFVQGALPDLLGTRTDSHGCR
jgi:hypothetical protein